MNNQCLRFFILKNIFAFVNDAKNNNLSEENDRVDLKVQNKIISYADI
jgi:hypothetical protein